MNGEHNPNRVSSKPHRDIVFLFDIPPKDMPQPRTFFYKNPS
jgi:hypothetical protein